MVKVKQTNDSIPGGDCMSACIASLLHMEINDVPNFCAEAHRDWMILFGAWLHKRGMGFGFSRLEDSHQVSLPGLCILGVRTQRHVDEGVDAADYLHAVVGSVDYSDVIRFWVEHDPAKEPSKVIEIVDMVWIVRNAAE